MPHSDILRHPPVSSASSSVLQEPSIVLQEPSSHAQAMNLIIVPLVVQESNKISRSGYSLTMKCFGHDG